MIVFSNAMPEQGAPLCPAGHLPHKGGDRFASRSPLLISRSILTDVSLETPVAPLVISPPVGEMPGRAEGGRQRRSNQGNYHSVQEAQHVAHS
ncbi:hypothetical protein EDF70_105179 [Neorhizobium sp. JUb45]|nr:hypothetical protein EDF70_105179 [Neorhizobium sp. JUb45]